MNGFLTRRLVTAFTLAAIALATMASGASAADPSITASPTTNLNPAGATIAVTGSDIPLTTGTPPSTGLYAAQIAIVGGITYVANNANAKFVRRNPTAGSAAQAKLEDDGSFSTSVAVVKGWGSGASAVDCMAADTQCFIASWPAHGNPSAANLIDSVAIEFADISATPTTNLNPAGDAVAVTGTNLSLTTGTPPSTGLYAAQIAIVDGTTYVANNANAKFVRRNPTAGSAAQAKLEDDGSFSTSVTVVNGWGSGASAVNCSAANTDCFIASWPAHGNPSAANVIDSVAIDFAPAADITATPTSGLNPLGQSVAVTGANIPLTTGTPASTGLYAAQIAIVDGTTYSANNANAKWVRRTPTAGSAGQAKLEDDGSFATSVDVVKGWGSGATAVDCTAANTDCFIASWPAHGNPSAANIIDSVAIDFAGDAAITATPTTDLNPLGEAVAVTGSNIPLTTGTPPSTGLYAAQIAIVDGTTYSANNANAKWVRRTPTAGSAGQAKLEDDGSFATSVDVVKGWGSGASAVDCRAANTQCFIASWPAHGNPSAANIIDSVEIHFAGDADISATPTTNLDRNGQAVAVTGTSIPLATGTPSGTGLYAAQIAIVDGTTYSANNANAKWVRRTPTAGSAGQAKLEDDGSFATSVDVVKGWGSGATAVDCTAANTQCFIASWPAHGNPSAANIIDSVAIEFAADPGPPPTRSVFVSQTTGLSTEGPTTVGVSGLGFSPSEPGIYLVYGPAAGNTNPNAFYSAQWLHVGGGNLSSTGTFSTSLAVVPTYTDGDGNVVNCTVVQCYVQTMRAHGLTDIDQTTAIPVSFGTVVPTPPASQAPQAQGPPTDAPSTGQGGTTPGASTTTTPAANPTVSDTKVAKSGKVSLDVSERSTVTFVLRKKVGGKWKVVKVVRVKADAGAVTAKLPVGGAGKYQVSIKAVSSVTGKASKKVVKTITVEKKTKKKSTKKS